MMGCLKGIQNSDKRVDRFQGKRRRVGRESEADSKSLHYVV